MAAPPLRWGVIGPGWIAQRFVAALHRSTAQRVVAVASRDLARAEAFAREFGIETAYGSYEQLLAAAGVDVAYIATPHNAHHPWALLALDAGKHVLVEKPLAINAPQAEEIADLARRSGLFCMEALWSFFLPKFDVIRQILDDGALGEVQTMIADNGEFFAPDHRIFRQDLAGGPLLDLGTYPVSLAVAVLGEPDHVLAAGQPAPSGVNGQAAAILSGRTGSQALIHTTILANTPTTATITGTAGTLEIAGAFYMPGPFSLISSSGARLEFAEAAVRHDALYYQAAEVARCIHDGLAQSPLRPLSDSVATMRVVDRIRQWLGVRFDGEAEA
jgi:predicted dehydrogenase